MEWYLWLLTIWAFVMGGLAAPVVWPLSNIKEEYSTFNDFIGYSLSIIILFALNDVLFTVNSSVMLALIGFLVISFLVSVFITIKDCNPETEENRLSRGKAIADSIKSSEENGANKLESALNLAEAAEEHTSDLKMAMVLSLVFLFPNAAVIYLGVSSFIK